jgi:hypothetical protein
LITEKQTGEESRNAQSNRSTRNDGGDGVDLEFGQRPSDERKRKGRGRVGGSREGEGVGNEVKLEWNAYSLMTV